MSLVSFSPSNWNAFEAIAANPVSDVRALQAYHVALSGKRRSFEALAELSATEPGFEGRFFDRILPSMVRYASAVPGGAAGALPVHRRGVPVTLRISRADALSWVAHLLLGTLVDQQAPSFPRLDVHLWSAGYPCDHAKLRCMLEIFDRHADAPPPGHLEVERVVVPARTADDWRRDGSPLTRLAVVQAGIETAVGHLQVDFANAFLGGGVLGRGCVQEEIRFSISPELLFGLLVSPLMGDDEAIRIRGAEQIARPRGYHHAFRFGGSFEDPAPRLHDGTPDVEVVAIDATHFERGTAVHVQLATGSMLRELNKARAGFTRGTGDARPVATGNWGGGAFNGDPSVKAVIQWIAASAEGRDVRYHRLHSPQGGDLQEFADAARARWATAGALWEQLLLLRTRPDDVRQHGVLRAMLGT